MTNVFQQLNNYLRNILDPSEERENETETIDNILKGINFRGSNLWVLICAIFIASLVKCKFPGSDYRGHADFPTHGPNHGDWPGNWH